MLAEMIERVIRYSTLSATATTQDKNKNGQPGIPSSTILLLSQLMHPQPKASASPRRPLALPGALGEVCFFLLTLGARFIDAVPEERAPSNSVATKGYRSRIILKAVWRNCTWRVVRLSGDSYRRTVVHAGTIESSLS